ncbi:glutamate receptor 1.3 [Arabidopsis thaliana]|uniref:Glutamate receptor n=1 Tax=Arabidopsis thaliana TaxID=3702 RepID=A0A1P8BHG9_ARATH|nr:glutamate receptor 1.3 [Arabidopsis thaliana]ANM71036.1 glutamate receptor 1.3 [Arabidopsis thaliana]|eukprot:NP_001332595.1 glutamate receptor 1.3 [Arabidopsis thaliana]
MERFCIQTQTLLSFLLVLLLFISRSFASTKNDDVDGGKRVQIRVGLVLDLGSLKGKIVKNSVSMALSYFYAIHNDYKTRVSVSLRNSHGEPLLALASAVDLLKTEGVEAIIGGNSLLEAKLLGELGEKARVPMISLDSPFSLSLSKYTHLIQATHDSTSEAKGITSFINVFDWNSVALVYEDHDDWRESMQLLVEHFHENGVRVQSKVGFTVSSSEDFVMGRLQQLKDLGTTVFVVHLSEVIATHLFPCARRLGLMGDGFVWILTAKTMNSFHENIDDFTKQAMEGVVGFKSYIPMSIELQNFTLRWRKSLPVEEAELTRLSISGIWAHDIAFALARAAEVIRMPNVTSTLLEEITKTRFNGLSGDFQLNDKKLLSNKFEIINMIGSSERRVGFLNSNGSFSNRRHLSSTHNKLETIIWPGGSAQSPKGTSLIDSDRKKLRVLVTSSNRFPRLMKVETDPVTNELIVEGFCIEVFRASISPFNYEVEYIPWLNGSNYDNLAYALHSQKDKYDAAVGDITITSNRSTYVDFTLPFTEMGLGIVAVKERKRAENKEFQGSWPQQIGVVLWFGFSTLVYAHREKLKHNLSRFVVTVWVFAVLILTASYTATLTSMMTVQQIRFNSNEDYVGHLSGSLIANVALTSSSLRAMRSLGLNSAADYAQALLNKTVSFVVDELPYLKVVLGENPTHFFMVKTQSTTNGFGFMFQKGFELVPNVSREISKLRTSEKLNEMEKRWFDNQLPYTTDDTSNPITLYRFRGLFIIIGVSFAFALAVLVILCLRDKWEILVDNLDLSQRLRHFRIHFVRSIHTSPLDDPIGETAVQMAQQNRQ